MANAKDGDRVTVHYTGTLEDGTVFDSSRDGDPLEFTLGENQVIPGFEKALVGMAVGETKKIIIPCEEAYGRYKDEHVGYVDRSHLPQGVDLEVGMILEARAPDGQVTKVRIKELTDESVVLDGNHPLAGFALTFDLELVAVA